MPASSTAASGFSERDVKLLVDMVRLSRVTLLVAEPGSEKSEFLRTSVMPLLNEKKRGSPGGEIGILFDEWNKWPLAALQARIRQSVGAAGIAVPPPGSGSLVENLETWQEAMTETFLIVLDRFEDLLHAPRDASGTAEFEATFVHIANDPTLRVNFLLAIEQDAEPLLANLRRHIPRLGYSSVRLPASRASAADSDRVSAEEAKSRTQTPRSAQREPRHAVERPEPAPAVALNVVPVARPATPTPLPSDTREVSPDSAPPARETSPVTREVAESSAEVAQAAPNTEDHTPEIPPQPVARTAASKRGFSRLAWVPAVLIAGAIVYVLWQPQFKELARRVSAPHSATSVARPEPAEVPPPSVPAAAPADSSPRASETRPAPVEPVASKPISPPKTSAAQSKPETPTPKAKPAAAAVAPSLEAREVRKPETAAPKTPPAPTASAPDRELRKPEAVAAKSSDPAPKRAPGDAAKTPVREAAVATAPATAAATTPATTPAQRATEGVSGPVLRINVRSEAQRAWAKQMIGPLRERGIHVAAIRVVPPHGDIAHIRYYRAAERTEAVRVAAALSDLGLSARQLRQIDEVAGATPARQYELWLAAEEKR